ncbi:MAG: PorT family protein [Bacteroidales bacterium]|nr:PorT family protein [Bacteroidales bacterium]
MKKILFLSLCLLCSFWGLAQSNTNNEAAKVTVGIRIGGTGSMFIVPKGQNISLNHPMSTSNRTMKIGMTAGIAVDIPLNDHISLQTGLYYSLQRAGVSAVTAIAQNDTDYSIASEIKFKTHHAKLPLMVMYHSNRSSNHFVAGAGLFVDLGMGGRVIYSSSAVLHPGNSYLVNTDFNPYDKGNKYFYYHETQDDHTDKYFYGKGPLFKRFDAGVSAELGYQFSSFYLGAHLDFGVLNTAHPALCKDNYLQRNLNIQVLLGYNFN